MSDEVSLSTPVLGLVEKRLLFELARRALSDLARPAVVNSESWPRALTDPGAAFVTLREAATGSLRGCCGETRPRRPLAESVVAMTVASALQDSRFPPVVAAEVPSLSIEITVLGNMAPIRPLEIAVGRHGLMIVCGSHRGILLPQVPIDQGWDRAEFLAALSRKAGLPDDGWTRPEAQTFAFEALHWGAQEVLDKL